MRALTVVEALEVHRRIIEQTGGSLGIHNLGALESALAQPHVTFGGKELYPNLVEKACALSFSIIMNHPFVDGNKRIGHALMELFLILNGYEIVASVDEQEQVILQVASGTMNRERFLDWLSQHISKTGTAPDR